MLIAAYFKKSYVLSVGNYIIDPYIGSEITNDNANEFLGVLSVRS